MIDELRALARAVSLDAGLVVELGAPGSGWSLEPATGTVRCDPDDIARQHPDDSRGLVCHEAAHAAVTRYPHLVPPKVLRTPALASLLNALEDCRIEEWLARRYPGASTWIDRYNARLFPTEQASLGRRPLVHQFCLGAIYEWWHGETPAGLDDRAEEALVRTREARQEVVDAQPPLLPTAGLGEGYASSPVARRFASEDRRSPPDGFERAVRLSAWVAWGIVWRQVRPIYEELLRIDIASRKDFAQADRAFLRELHGHLVPSVLRRARRSPMGAQQGTGEGSHSAVSLPVLMASERAALSLASNPDAHDPYEAARRRVEGLARPMAEQLLRVLRLDAYPHWLSGYSAGARPDLKAVMQSQADPRRRTLIWQRKTMPRNHDPAFFLLVDLSGSMDGPAIVAAFRGVVLLCEVLHQLQVPFAVAGFQDQLIELKSFEVALDDTVRERLGHMAAEVVGQRAGGRNHPEHNWDGPVLRGAAAQLLARPAGQRVLLVVSDGQPSGPHDGQAQLHEAVARVEGDGRLHLVGIGLGPGTEHVARYYADHAASVPLAAFPAALGAILQSQIRDTR